MKNLFLLGILYICCLSNLSAQGSHIKTYATTGDLFYIASLPLSDHNAHEKLKIKIFGGDWNSGNLGTRTYSISSRDVLRVSQEQTGGASEKYRLKIYKSDSGYDFVIESVHTYLSVYVEASLGAGSNETITPVSPRTITRYTAGNNIDITNQVEFNYIYTTDRKGNIGIGVVTPQAKLDVNGTIRSKEVKIEAAGWSDFVFGEDYRLPSLSEVESHIKTHKHLPDIPSEKEVLKEGVNVVEMQAKLLQKIEELTLYMIEQDKKYESLKHENEAIKQELKEYKNQTKKD